MEEDVKGIALIILGIIAVLSVVGLVIMLSNAQKTGNLVLSSTELTAQEYQNILAARQYGLPGADATVGPRRPGQPPQPAYFKQRIDDLKESSDESQVYAGSTPEWAR